MIAWDLLPVSTNAKQKKFLSKDINEVSLKKGFVVSKARESRDKNGKLTCVTVEKRLEVMRGMPVFNVLTDKIEKL